MKKIIVSIERVNEIINDFTNKTEVFILVENKEYEIFTCIERYEYFHILIVDINNMKNREWVKIHYLNKSETLYLK